KIAPGYVDQVAFDAAMQRLYCAGGAGVISVVGETARGIKLFGLVPSHKGSHTLALDPATHSVWISYPDASGSFLQEYRAR
ncbi:MAG: hypothetical protein LC772_06425, partial [Chloroflexi bacterium]|nr:hypothetical protein [Chloroflexota bacterium]